jgi:hypothetical protein
MELTSNPPLAPHAQQLEHQLHPFNKEGTGGTTVSAVHTSSSSDNLSDEQLLQLFVSRNLRLPENTVTLNKTQELPNVVIIAPKATGNDWENHPIYKQLTSQNSKDAFEAHWKRTEKTAESGEKGPIPPMMRDKERKLVCPDDDPFLFRHKCMELVYSKPEGFLSVNRSFFPTGPGNQLKRDAAVRNLPPNSVPSEITSMMELQDEMHSIFVEQVPAKIKLKYHEKAAELKIMHHGKVVTQFEQIKTEFHENPSRALLAKLYALDYGLREDDHSMNEIKYEICQELKVYCTASDLDKDFVKRGKATVPKAHFLNKMICDKFRQISRSLIYGSPQHGISLTISNKDREASRRPKCFSFDDNVKGWQGPMHVAFLEKKNSMNEAVGGTKEEVHVSAKRSLFRDDCHLPFSHSFNFHTFSGTNYGSPHFYH